MVSTGRITKRSIPDAVKRAVLEESEGCAYCFDLKAPLQVEHYVPLSRGGLNDRGNLRAVCVSCNSQKRAMLFHEWRAYRTTHGMPWPPVATHATDPQHYGDKCSQCQRAYGRWRESENEGRDIVPQAMLSFACKPFDFEFVRSGYRWHYACPLGHSWTCWYALANWYFSDCMCDWCQVSRADAGDETFPRIPFYNSSESQIAKLLTRTDRTT